MFNCYRLFIDGELFCICPTYARARSIAVIITGLSLESEYSIIGEFIENIGF